MRACLAFCFAAVACLSGAAAPVALAQDSQPADRPFRALFGRGSEMDPFSTQSVDANVSVYGGFDDNVAAGELDNPTVRQRLGSYYTGLEGQLSYGKRGRHFDFGVSGGGTIRRFEGLDELDAPSAFADAGLGVQLGQHTSLSLGQSFRHSPYYEFGLNEPALPGSLGSVAASSFDRALLRLRTNTYSSSVSMSHELTRRSSIGAEYSLRLVSLTQDSSAAVSSRFTSHRAGVHYSRTLTPNASLRLGYAFGSSPISLVSNTGMGKNHDIDAGLDYTRPLTLSRRTTLSLGFGSTIVVRSELGDTDDAGLNRTGTLFGVIGRARLNHRMGETWIAALTYDRGVDYIEVFAEPLFSDTLGVSLNGSLSRRLAVVASARYASGGVGFEGANSFDTVGAGAGLRFALSRFVALYADYDYHQYTLGDDVLVLAGIPRDLDRQGVRAGITIWLPLARF